MGYENFYSEDDTMLNAPVSRSIFQRLHNNEPG